MGCSSKHILPSDHVRRLSHKMVRIMERADSGMVDMRTLEALDPSVVGLEDLLEAKPYKGPFTAKRCVRSFLWSLPVELKRVRGLCLWALRVPSEYVSGSGQFTFLGVAQPRVRRLIREPCEVEEVCYG